MSEVRHHIPDEILLEYSAGSLPEAFSLVVASHVSLCEACRDRLDALDGIGGAMIENIEAVAMPEGAFEATMDRILGKKPVDPAPARRARGIFPAPLQDYVGGDLDKVRWRGLGRGVKQAILPTQSAANVRLIYIPAGMKMPEHSHRGTEMTMVLQGAYCDESDRFTRGDIEIADSEMHHTPVAEAGEDCICLTATDAPLRFNALIPRIAQPFLRI